MRDEGVRSQVSGLTAATRLHDYFELTKPASWR